MSTRAARPPRRHRRPDDPVEALVAEADRHPVLRLRAAAGPGR